MNHFDIATYIRIIQKALNSGQGDAGQLLFGVFLFNEHLDLKFNASGKDISDLISHKKEIPSDLLEASKRPEIRQEVHDYFSRIITPRIISYLLNDACENLQKVLKSDPSVSRHTVLTLEEIENEQGQAIFLAECFLYALNLSNTNKKTKHPTKVNTEDVALATLHVQDGVLHINHHAFQLDQHLSVPQTLEDDELPYIHALLSAYADAEHAPVVNLEHLPELPKKYSQNFEEQRQNYYRIESIRRGIRDTFSSNECEHQFSELKDDLYEGIVDYTQDDYDNGFERLKAVLKQSLVISLKRSELSELSGLIGNSQRKGICHLLVNDGRITWVP